MVPGAYRACHFAAQPVDASASSGSRIAVRLLSSMDSGSRGLGRGAAPPAAGCDQVLIINSQRGGSRSLRVLAGVGVCARRFPTRDSSLWPRTWPELALVVPRAPPDAVPAEGSSQYLRSAAPLATVREAASEAPAGKAE